MKKLSLCMIVKDEQECLARALENADIFADEIIIVDTGSSDKTKEIAKNFSDKIYDFKWVGDFSKARNFSFDKASCPYIMWLDADDIVPNSSAESIADWKKQEEDVDVVMCPYVANYDENFNPVFEYLRERIVKNSKALRWHDRVHEVIVPSGKIINSTAIKIFHGKKKKEATSRNLLIYKQMLEEGEKLSPRSNFYYARELYFNNYINEAIHEFSRFLSGGEGWKENNIEACLNLAKCYCLQEKYSNALTSLFGSFIYDIPRSEVLYEIGNIYSQKEEFSKAIYWYKLALASKPEIESGGFVNIETCTFLPALALCVCYDKMGDKLNAFHYHEIAKGFKPQDKSVLHNQEYFDNLMKNTKK